MKAVDTNILIRYIMSDDVVQRKMVSELFENASSKKQCFFVSMAVVLEMDWVLSSHFKLKRGDVIAVLLDLLELEVLKFEYCELLQNTLTFAKTNTYDLSDLLIGAIAKANDCTTTLTFDKKASKSPDFELLS